MSTDDPAASPVAGGDERLTARQPEGSAAERLAAKADTTAGLIQMIEDQGLDVDRRLIGYEQALRRAVTEIEADAAAAPSAPTPEPDGDYVAIAREEVANLSMLLGGWLGETHLPAVAAERSRLAGVVAVALHGPPAPTPVSGERRPDVTTLPEWAALVAAVENAAGRMGQRWMLPIGDRAVALVGASRRRPAAAPSPTDGERDNTTYPCQVQQAGSGTCTWPTCGCGGA